jgi:hypothetical protein
LELRARLRGGAIFLVVDAWHRTRVLGLDPQAHLAFIVWTGLHGHLGRGLLLLWLLRDIAVLKVFPETSVTSSLKQCVQTLGRQPGHAGLLSVAIEHIGPARLILILGPEQILGLVADGIELLLHVQV